MVLVTVLLASCHGRATVTGRQSAPLTNTPGAGGGGTAANGGTTGGVGPGTVAAAGDNNLVTLDGQARSVETTATVTGLSSVHLTGSSNLTATGDVIDQHGRDLGSGTLRAAGNDLTVTGTSVQLSSRLRVQPGPVTVNSGPSGGIGVAFSGTATIASAQLTFQPPPPAPPPPVVATGSPTALPATTTVPPPVAVAGPVTFRGSGVQIAGAGLALVNAPADLSVASGEADLSWAGTGAITTATGPLQATYLGVRGQQLQVTLHRGGGVVDLHGTALALQAYANGVPQLRVPARVDIVSSGATTGFLGRRHAFVWTPRNLGNSYDMAILSIHPGNAAAGGVHIGLQPMPPMFGGETHALVGGDTAGLKSGDAIASLIARHGDDKRSVGYDAPPGVPLVLVVQGNFDTITVTVTTY